MNISVKKFDANSSTKELPRLFTSIMDNSEGSFDAVEVNRDEEIIPDTSIRKKCTPANLSQVIGSMTNINLSFRGGSILVETSIISGGVGIKEEVNPLAPEEVKLAFTSTWNLIVGVVLLLLLVITGSMLGPITMSIKAAKHSLFKALWRAESN